MRWRTVLPLSLAVVIALVAGVIGILVHEDDPPAATGPPAPASPFVPTTAPGPPAGATAIGGVLPELQAFVAKARGLAFKVPVDVELLADAEFRARLEDADEEDLRELADTQAVLRAMGLLRSGLDLAAIVEQFSADAILGFYDPESDELVVRGASPTPFVRTVLVHELTHALEDQHFDINRVTLGDEASSGFGALVEGSALRIEDRYRSSLSRRDQQEAEREERALGDGGSGDVPEVVRVAFGFPYDYGPDLVSAILREGGQARLDAAYARPPMSTENVLDPDTYLRGDAPRPVPLPRADRKSFDDGEIGALFLDLMLQAELGGREARRAAIGWGGDSYVAWRDGGRTCVRMAFVMDTPDDTAELTDALRRWAAKRGDAASATGTSLTTCG